MNDADRSKVPVERSMRYVVWLAGAGVVLVLFSLLIPRPGKPPAQESLADPGSEFNLEGMSNGRGLSARGSPSPSAYERRAMAQEVVSGKVRQFARGRQEIVKAMAEKLQVEVSPEIGQFFAAVEAGDWKEVTNRFAALKELRTSPERKGLGSLWPAIQETFGVAEVAQKWAPEKLLSYGQAILESLRPGMVYAGGTDAGRFIPTLLNETSEGERHIVLTQNALADISYVQYLNFLYADKMASLTTEDAQRVFSSYIDEAQRRFKDGQLRPGEDVRVTEGRVQVSGQVAVMMINEKLFGLITERNPEMSFAMEESFPFKSAYADAVPLGPILELRGAGTLTPEEMGNQAVAYWQGQAGQFGQFQAGEGAEDFDERAAWSKMASAQGGLLEDRGARGQAAAVYEVAMGMCPSNPEVVMRYTNLLLAEGRMEAALAVAERGLAAAPDNAQFKDLAGRLRQGR